DVTGFRLADLLEDDEAIALAETSYLMKLVAVGLHVRRVEIQLIDHLVSNIWNEEERDFLLPIRHEPRTILRFNTDGRVSWKELRVGIDVRNDFLHGLDRRLDAHVLDHPDVKILPSGFETGDRDRFL